MSKIATLIFTRYFFPFEVTSALLITAALGAMVLAHRERTSPKPTQRDLSRPAGGRRAPGAAARAGDLRPPQRGGHPALLPDGSPGGAVGQPRRLRAARRAEAVSEASARRGALPRARKERTSPSPAQPGPTGPGQLMPAGEEPTGTGRTGSGHEPGDTTWRSPVILFVIGAVGVLIRRNAMVIFMCIELMLNAVNLAFVAFARQHGQVDGRVVAFFVMVVAAAEVVVGLAILMAIFRARRSASVDDANLLKY